MASQDDHRRRHRHRRARHAEAAHAVTSGEGITIAIIDNGVDIDHADFGGAGKVVSPRDAT